MTSTAHDLIQKHRLTVTDYHRMGEVGILREDDRVELIEGEIIDMSPIGSRHAGIVSYLDRMLNRVVGERAIVWAQNPVVLNEGSEPQPDLMLLGPKEDFYITSLPRPEDVILLVEVCESSLRYDRDTKLPLYARHGIPEVWLVDVEHQQLSVFRRLEGGAYQDVTSPASLGVVTPERLPSAAVDLSHLFQPTF